VNCNAAPKVTHLLAIWNSAYVPGMVEWMNKSSSKRVKDKMSAVHTNVFYSQCKLQCSLVNWSFITVAISCQKYGCRWRIWRADSYLSIEWKGLLNGDVDELGMVAAAAAAAAWRNQLSSLMILIISRWNDETGEVVGWHVVNLHVTGRLPGASVNSCMGRPLDAQRQLNGYCCWSIFFSPCHKL